ncbi:Transposon Ty3-I Gag-Pol polyprotein [Pelomyxa schiedti]|nr:Transposon Ty3-I Gag-Pol polyprotein [Pelomyxa schiedti]
MGKRNRGAEEGVLCTPGSVQRHLHQRLSKAREDKPRTASYTDEGMSASVSAGEGDVPQGQGDCGQGNYGDAPHQVIKEGKSEWVAPLSLSPKKDGSIRLCTNFRGLNKETIKDNYPLPSVFDVLKALSGHNWFSTLDLMSGFWQVPVAEEDVHKTGLG